MACHVVAVGVGAHAGVDVAGVARHLLGLGHTGLEAYAADEAGECVSRAPWSQVWSVLDSKPSSA